MAANTETISAVEKATKDYKYGFVTDIETEFAPKGLSEDIVKFISKKNDEPLWLLEWRLDAILKSLCKKRYAVSYLHCISILLMGSNIWQRIYYITNINNSLA